MFGIVLKILRVVDEVGMGLEKRVKQRQRFDASFYNF